MLKAIIFDFGQTLVDSADGFRLAEKEAQVEIFNDLPITSWKGFIADYRRIRKEFHLHSNLSRKAIWQEVYRHYCQEVDMQLLAAKEKNYWQTVETQTTIFPETRQVLEKLTATYRLALISNTQGQNGRERHRLKEYPQLRKLFDAVVIAGESGIKAKPDSEPFLTCLKKLALTAEQVIYVGDDWYTDILGALEVGIQPIWLKHHQVKRNWPVVETSVPIITSLEQLFNLKKLFR